MRNENMTRYLPVKEHFGTWLLAQFKREDMIGELARAAKRDSGFPFQGDPQAVSKRLNALQADPEMHLALEEAELDWAAY